MRKYRWPTAQMQGISTLCIIAEWGVFVNEIWSKS
nr:MAG TPA: hypothetical protein [Caudoviricetes sp.]